MWEKANANSNKWFDEWSKAFNRFRNVQAELGETQAELREAYRTIQAMRSELQRNKPEETWECVFVIDEDDAVIDDIHCNADDKALSII